MTPLEAEVSATHREWASAEARLNIARRNLEQAEAEEQAAMERVRTLVDRMEAGEVTP